MSVYACPKGHPSTEPDFCSDCGAKIQNGALTPALNGADSTAKSVPAAEAVQCPDCEAPRHDEGSFCEVCGYNFVTGAHGEIPLAANAPAILSAINPVISAAVVQWSLQVSVDPALRAPESPEVPADAKPFTIHLQTPVNLIGRGSASRGITPEVPLDYDDAVSHRHALINLGPDGALTLRDIGSANGTKLNGAELKPMADMPLHDGDEIALGHWTRILVKSEKAP